MFIAVVVIGIGIAVGQAILRVVRAIFSITHTGIANLLAFVIVTPGVYFAYWMYVRYVERREVKELGRPNVIQEFGLGSFIGFGLFALVIAILWMLGFYRSDTAQAARVDRPCVFFAGSCGHAQPERGHENKKA